MKRIIFNAFCLFSFIITSALASETKTYEIKNITYLNIEASINPAVFNYLEDNFQKIAKKENQFVLIKLNTPGGLVTTTKDIITLIGSQKFPVGVWITPEGASATSAGAIIASSAHVLVMSEGTNIGAATPITMGKDIEKGDSRNKAINDLMSVVRSLSKVRGRNASEFEKMISEAKSLDARQALESSVIDKIINTKEDLLTYLENIEVNIVGEKVKLSLSSQIQETVIEMDAGQQILNIFSNPSTAYILFIIGAALLYFELQAPGGIIAGALGALCLLLAGIGFQVLPLNMGAFGLIILSFLLFVAEAYITSFGVLAIGGILSLVFGSLFLFRTDNSLIQLEYSLIISVVASISAYVLFIGWFMIKTYKKSRDRFVHTNQSGSVMKVLGDKKYQIKIEGEIWNASSDEELSLEDKVEVISQEKEHLNLKIKKIN